MGDIPGAYTKPPQTDVDPDIFREALIKHNFDQKLAWDEAEDAMLFVNRL